MTKRSATSSIASGVLALTALAALVGCPDDPTTDASETTSAPDTADDTGTATDTGVSPDTSTDTSVDSDASGTTTTAAVLGARCELDERVGLFEVSASFGPAPYVSGWVQDKADPWYGEPELTTAACDFHVINPVDEPGGRAARRRRPA